MAQPHSSPDERPRSTGGAAFLLAQIGAHAAASFSRRLEPLGMTPPQAGVLRHLAHSPGNSQRELAEALGMHAPRLTALIDDLEGRGLVQRTRDPNDRRNYVLTLTAAGHQSLAQVATVARAHEHAITTALDDAERTQLAALLGRVAAEQGLAPGVHPGFRRMGR